MVRDAGIGRRRRQRGVDSILHVLGAALNQHTTGAYFDQQRVARADKQAYEVSVRDALRAQTIELVWPFL